jgi:hypothetical protein
MAVEITPEPPDYVGEALIRALERHFDRAPAASAWWVAGVRESVEDDEDQP